MGQKDKVDRKTEKQNASTSSHQREADNLRSKIFTEEVSASEIAETLHAWSRRTKRLPNCFLSFPLAHFGSSSILSCGIWDNHARDDNVFNEFPKARAKAKKDQKKRGACLLSTPRVSQSRVCPWSFSWMVLACLNSGPAALPRAPFFLFFGTNTALLYLFTNST